MSLTRKLLKSMGIDEEKIEQIIEEHLESVNALKAERDTYKAEAEKVPELEKKVKDSENDNGEEWKAKFEKEKSDFDAFKKELTAKEEKAAKESAYKELLKNAGISEKRIASIVKVTDLDGISLEDGKIKDAEKIAESVKTEWADFIETTTISGAQTVTPPANNQGEVDLSKLSMAEYIAARNKK